MRILLCHNHYQLAGGEDQSFEDEARLLELHGHEVRRFTVHNDDIKQMTALTVARRTIWNTPIQTQLHELISRESPDVMHCTNTFPLISPSAYYAARSLRVPVVQSLRNYRLLCPNALFLRNGKVCEDCLGKPFAFSAIKHKCYRGSRAATAVVAGMVSIHRALGTWKGAVDLYYTPSEFARQKFIAAGFNPEKIAVKPNSVHPDPGAGTGGGGYAVFAGRLSEEKGISTLLQAWPLVKNGLRLKIIGDGPMADEVKRACAASNQIEWLGRRPIVEVLELIGNAACLIAPSIVYETFGRTIVEAFAKGTPVIVSDGGASAELVEEGRTGLHFKTGNAAELAAKVAALMGESDASQPGQMGRMRAAARATFERHYSGEANYRMLMAIYERAISGHKAGSRRVHAAKPASELALSQVAGDAV